MPTSRRLRCIPLGLFMYGMAFSGCLILINTRRNVIYDVGTRTFSICYSFVGRIYLSLIAIVYSFHDILCIMLASNLWYCFPSGTITRLSHVGGEDVRSFCIRSSVVAPPSINGPRHDSVPTKVRDTNHALRALRATRQLQNPT